MSAGMKVARSDTKPTGRPLVIRGQGAKPLYLRKNGAEQADINARMAAARKFERKRAKRRALVAKGAIHLCAIGYRPVAV